MRFLQTPTFHWVGLVLPVNVILGSENKGRSDLSRENKSSLNQDFLTRVRVAVTHSLEILEH